MLLDYAALELINGAPYSRQYRDIYYNPEQGRAETEHVFIHGNHLIERFSGLHTQQQFTIGETGFGTGLNFLITAEHFLHHAPAHNHLNYISVEKHPIELNTLKILQQHWPLPELRENLYCAYPHNHPGFHLLKPHPQISLLLLLGEANELLPELYAHVDAWYLDGFAPAKNQTLWSETVIQSIAANSHSQTTLATYSAARLVKEQLIAAGFQLEKRKGFGRKRDMLSARYHGKPRKPHWSHPPQPLSPQHPIHIIGAGLAGASTARVLAEMGIPVHLSHAPIQHPAASTVPLAVPYLQPGIEDTAMRRYHLSSWHHAIREIYRYAATQTNILEAAPIHLMAENEKQKRRHRALYQQQLLNAQEWSIDEHATLTLHRLGILHTPTLLQTLLQHPNITTHQTHIQTLSPDTPTILATAANTTLLPPDWRQQLTALRGQALILKSYPNTPYAQCGGHSILRSQNGDIYIGSTYQPNNSKLQLSISDRAQLQQYNPEANAHYHSDFIGIRATTRDYLPLLGALPDPTHLKSQYARWAKNAKHPIHIAAHYPSPHYIHAGLGSKGSLTTWLGADHLSAILLGKPLPLPLSLHAQLSPARTIIKNIIRGT